MAHVFSEYLKFKFKSILTFGECMVFLFTKMSMPSCVWVIVFFLNGITNVSYKINTHTRTHIHTHHTTQTHSKGYQHLCLYTCLFMHGCLQIKPQRVAACFGEAVKCML